MLLTNKYYSDEVYGLISVAPFSVNGAVAALLEVKSRQLLTFYGATTSKNSKRNHPWLGRWV